MYRAVTLFALEQGVPIDAEHQQEMLALIETADFEFNFVDGGLRIFYGPRDLTEDIRSREVTGMVSHAAALPEVRRGMCALQRQMANSSNVVMEGRDIGTVVLPMATYKFFLTASAEVRAMRRYQELMAKGIEIDFATVLKEITERDRLDSSRKYAPLCKADDAIELDTSGLDAEEVLSLVLSIIK